MAWPKHMNVSRFEAMMAESEFDVLVASSLKNVYYTSGALIETQRRIPLRLALSVLPREGEPTLIVCNIEERHARQDSPFGDIRTYVEFVESPVEVLAKVLEQKGLHNKRIGIEKEHLTALHHEELVGRLRRARFGAADRFFADLRMIKTDLEIEVIRNAAIQTERAIADGLAETAPGDREKDLDLRLQSKLIAAGASSIRASVVGAGPNSLRAHNLASDKRLLVGEVVRIDFSGYFGAYASDVARMAVVEAPSQAVADLYRRYHEIQRATISAMRAGIEACSVFALCRQQFEKAGMTFHTPHIGHGTGVDGGHEEPMLQPNETRVLQPNMLLCIEPVFRDTAIGAFHVEDLVLITEEGPEILTDQTDTAKMFVIGGRG